MSAALPELLLDAFSGPSGVAMVAAVLTILSTARILWSPSYGQVSIEVVDATIDTTPTKTGRRRAKLSPAQYADDYEMPPRKPSPAAKRRVPVFTPSPESDLDMPLHRAYGRERGTLRYYVLLVAIVYMVLFLPSVNRLPVVFDLTWAGLPGTHPILSGLKDGAAEAPLINDVKPSLSSWRAKWADRYRKGVVSVGEQETEKPVIQRWVGSNKEAKAPVPVQEGKKPVVPVAKEVKVEKPAVKAVPVAKEIPADKSVGGEENGNVAAGVSTTETLRNYAEAALHTLTKSRGLPQGSKILGPLAPVQPLYRVERPEAVLQVGRAYNASDVPMGNRCFYEPEETDCLPYYMIVQRNGKLQVREGRSVGKGRVRWSPRRKPNVDWARRIAGRRQWFELKLTHEGILELRTGKGQLRWQSSKEGGLADKGYEAFVDDEGRLVIFLRDELQWKSR